MDGSVEGRKAGFAQIGDPEVRIDGPAKVTGAARYASDEPAPGAAYAWLITSSIARGRVTGFHEDEARAVPGYIELLTFQNVGNEAKPPPPPGGKGGKQTTTMEADRVWHDGQIVGVVLAETFEAAREAARRVRVDYAEEKPSAGFDSPGVETVAVADVEKSHKDPKVGDFDAAFAAAPVKISARYQTPTQHHNPMELFTTTCAWQDGRLTIWESTQFVHGMRATLAKQLTLPPERIRALSRFIGGAFGSRGSATARTAWIAVAARRLNRPVRLEATRDQGFTIATYRAETRQDVKLAAGRDGKLTALSHEGWEVTSRPTDYNVSGTTTTTRVYACPNVFSRTSMVHADRNTPGFMRAPPETPYMFGLESGMDELSYALGMDPLELRRINDTLKEPIEGKPYTSRHLRECIDAGAKQFGWDRREPKPGAMRDGDWLVGYGYATAAYPANIGAASARVRLGPDGKARVEMAAIDVGTGSYTVIALCAADRLGVKVEDVEVAIGDSDLPPAGLSAGSMHGSAISNAVAKACDSVRDRIARAAVADDKSPFRGADPASLRLGGGQLIGPSGKEPLKTAVERVGSFVECYEENVPQGAPPDSIAKLSQGQMSAARGSEMPDMRYAFGAQFVEVRVHRLTREVRAPRAVGAFAAGRILNPVTAKSQLMGGMIWGISAALHEATEIDRRTARYYNDDLAEYLVPVNADIGTADVILIPEEDKIVNLLGVKGVGELGITGMNAAVANAVFHATGVRIRELPVRIEKLL
ncbi:MAG TPA: xanthine dehydrogenase family protein molybdopterin-binding subunit [Caulobacteraceae bacterium]|jgi:xanthine dehydrogenase YagR molybdenum-binding subunit|nr:xanthine dehydrogenase family protein molybdopterin-binding subunit [Caulobacteraceae bacterium]